MSQLSLPSIGRPPQQYGMFLMWDVQNGYSVRYPRDGRWLVAYAFKGEWPERKEDTFLELEAVGDEVVVLGGWPR